MKKRLVSLLIAALVIALLVPFTVLANGTHTADGDINLATGDLASKTLDADGYSWDAATNTLTIQDLTVTGSIVIPNKDTTIIVKGTCVVNSQIVRTDANAEPVTLKGEPGATLSANVSVPGPLIVKDLEIVSGELHNASVGLTGQLTLDNSTVNILDLGWSTDGGIKLINSKLTVDPNGMIGSFRTEKIEMDKDSQIISKVNMSNYGHFDVSDVETLNDYISEPVGGKFAKSAPFPGAADTYLTVVDKDGNMAHSFILKAPKAQHTVDVTADPANVGSVTGSGTFDEGTSVTVKAVANDGYHFVKWTENGATVNENANYTFSVDKNRSLVAVFEKDSVTPPLPPQEVKPTPKPANKGNTSSAKVTPAATNDPSNIALFGVMAVLGATGTAGIVYKKRKSIEN